MISCFFSLFTFAIKLSKTTYARSLDTYSRLGHSDYAFSLRLYENVN